MANKHMKRCLLSLVMMEILIQTTMTYHFIPTRMAIILKNEKYKKIKKKKKNNTYWQRNQEIGTLTIHFWWECKIVQLLGKSLAVPLKVKHKITM